VGAGFAKQIGMHRVYVLRDSSLYGQLLAEAFANTATRVGLLVVGGPEDTETAGNDQAIAERVRQAAPDLVYWGGSDQARAARLWRDLRAALGNDVKLMASDSIYSNFFLEAGGAAAEGTYVTATTVPTSRLSGVGADWYRRYIQQFQSEPFGYAPYAYEATNVALSAVARVGKKDRAAIRDAIFATRDHAGILGNWSFDANGDTTLTSMSILQVRNGSWDQSAAHIVQAPR